MNSAVVDVATTPVPPLIVKVGGSLVETGRVGAILASIRSAKRPVIIVPGGGTFANKVRDLQLVMRFDDAAAHRLAMLGMHQMAEVFLTLEPGFRIADSLDALKATASEGEIPMWVPLPMMDADRTVPANWSTTSDSLAARLAEILGSPSLVLLKSVDVPDGVSAAELASEGVVDTAFPSIVERAHVSWRIFGPKGQDAFESLLQRPDA